MDKKPIGYTAGKGSILDKKVPKNTKYEHIEAKLLGKTGTTIKDIAFMSNPPSIHRQQINHQKEQRTLPQDQTLHPLENDQPRKQLRVHLCHEQT
jgi:hypothetical protein